MSDDFVLNVLASLLARLIGAGIEKLASYILLKIKNITELRISSFVVANSFI
ncbi:hypothetical protein [Nitrososphaera sp.]|uniref:hypothetical protein n=1 Tax=Nitrososphaera sp. TaxID=1971748 RepID=UPI00307E86F1